LSFVIGASFTVPASSFTTTFLPIAKTQSTVAGVKLSSSYRSWLILCCCVLTGCGGASHRIVGAWRVGDDPNAMVWEFSTDGSVLMGPSRGRYSFGDNNRIKIETPIATSVYQMEFVGDKMTLKDPNGSKLVLTKVK
jgi:hypothetical protein